MIGKTNYFICSLLIITCVHLSYKCLNWKKREKHLSVNEVNMKMTLAVCSALWSANIFWFPSLTWLMSNIPSLSSCYAMKTFCWYKLWRWSASGSYRGSVVHVYNRLNTMGVFICIYTFDYTSRLYVHRKSAQPEVKVSIYLRSLFFCSFFMKSEKCVFSLCYHINV